MLLLLLLPPVACALAEHKGLGAQKPEVISTTTLSLVPVIKLCSWTRSSACPRTTLLATVVFVVVFSFLFLSSVEVHVGCTLTNAVPHWGCTLTCNG